MLTWQHMLIHSHIASDNFKCPSLKVKITLQETWTRFVDALTGPTYQPQLYIF